MTDTPDRRAFLKAAAATGALGAVGAPAAEAQTGAALKFSEPAPFSFETLQEEARRLIKEPYRPPAVPDPQITSKIDYEAWGKITYNTDYALYAADKERFPVEFFHLGMFFKKAVRIHKVDGGEAREILYDPAYPARVSRAFACRSPKAGSWTGKRTTGWRFSEPPIFAPSANCASTACRREE